MFFLRTRISYDSLSYNVIRLLFIRRLNPHRVWNLVEVNVTHEQVNLIQSTIDQLMLPSKTILDRSIATALWFAAQGQGT